MKKIMERIDYSVTIYYSLAPKKSSLTVNLILAVRRTFLILKKRCNT